MVIIAQKIVLMNRENNTALFLKRTDYKGDGGVWDLPGGRLDEKEDLKRGIIREVREEVQVQLHSFKPLDLYSNYSGDADFYFILYVGDDFSYLNKEINDIILSSEHTDFKWFTSEEIKNLDLKGSVEKLKEEIINYLSTK